MHPSSSTVMQPETRATLTAERVLFRHEVRLLATLATGVTVPVVAERLGISDRTVRRHIRRICSGLGVNTPIEAVAWAARRRII